MSGAPARMPVPPVPAGPARPLWSVMIPAYNCARHLRDALAGVLAQDPGPERMQIEVVDDASTRDDPAAVVEEVGGGRVGFHRQPRNVGHVRNFQTCLERSRGRLVHLLHGDDGVRPGFYRAMEEAFAAEPGLGAAFCRHLFMDEDGNWLHVSRLEGDAAGVLGGWLERIAVGFLPQASSVVVARRVYEHLGGFDRRIRRYGEDWEMWTRIAAHYPVWFEPEPLALYRSGPGSLTATSVQTGENVRDLRRVIAINAAVLPAHSRRRISRAARRGCAGAALRTAHRGLHAGRPEAALPQLREALRCSLAPGVLAQAAVVLGAWCRRRLRSASGGA